MNLTNMFRVIGRHKALLVFGILVAVAAALFTAFKVETGSLWASGTLEPRSQVEYRASTHILVSDPVSVFSSRNASQEVPDGTTAATARDLSSLTVVYAYLASSDEMLAQVEEQVGPLSRDESLTAQQRTTQPTSPTNTGTYRLPILDIMGTSPDPARAEEISRTAATLFQEFAEKQQKAADVPAESRVQLPVIDEREALPIDGTNPALPVVAVGLGVLLGFLALIFAVDNAQTGRRQAATVSPAREPIPSPVAATTVSTGPVPVLQPTAGVGQVAYRPAPQPQQAQQSRHPDPVAGANWTGRPAGR
jgi:capsular polysaccharide biosynthesis protein